MFIFNSLIRIIGQMKEHVISHKNIFVNTTPSLLCSILATYILWFEPKMVSNFKLNHSVDVKINFGFEKNVRAPGVTSKIKIAISPKVPKIFLGL